MGGQYLELVEMKALFGISAEKIGEFIVSRVPINRSTTSEVRDFSLVNRFMNNLVLPRSCGIFDGPGIIVFYSRRDFPI